VKVVLVLYVYSKGVIVMKVKNIIAVLVCAGMFLVPQLVQAKDAVKKEEKEEVGSRSLYAPLPSFEELAKKNPQLIVMKKSLGQSAKDKMMKAVLAADIPYESKRIMIVSCFYLGAGVSKKSKIMQLAVDYADQELIKLLS
jgi:ABC-type Fe3+-hydroxamate transport system substrate-binding protein